MRVKKSIDKKQNTLFPGLPVDNPWDSTTTVKRHFLQFPFYPFRTLNTRDLSALGAINEFDASSPIFPANTQLNINFKRRNIDSLINFMLPYNLNYKKGSTSKALTLAERSAALKFSVPDGAAFKDWSIIGIEIVLKDLYLQV